MLGYAVLIVGLACLQLALAGYARAKGDVPGARAFSWLLVGTVLWAGASGLEAFAPAWALVPIAAVKMTGIALVPTAWFAFALSYLGFDLSSRIKAALSVEPILVVLVTVTNPLTGLLWVVTGVEQRAGFSYLVVDRGPMFWAHAAYSYALVSTTLVLLLGVALLTPRFRTRVLGLFVGVSFPVAANVAYLGGVSPSNLDLTPVAFVASGLVFAWLLFANSMFEVPPVAPWVAHGVAFDSLTDAVVVLDSRGGVVEANAAAVRVFDRAAGDLVGTSFESLVADRLGVDLPPPSTAPTVEAQLHHDGRIRHYVLRVTPLSTNDPVELGYLASLQDVTEREVQQQRLAVLNRVLRHNVRNDMNVVAGFADLIAADAADPVIEQYAGNIATRADHLARWSDRARQAENVLESAATTTTALDLAETLDVVVDRVGSAHPTGTVSVVGPTAFDLVAPPTFGDALAELVTNGLEHNDSDNPHVTVTVERRDDGGLDVVVDDDGGGPAPEELPSLDDEREPLAHGIGFGLWFVSWTAWALGGELTTRSTDEGVAVVVRVPAARVSPIDDADDRVLDRDATDGALDRDATDGALDRDATDGALDRDATDENPSAHSGSEPRAPTATDWPSATDGGSDTDPDANGEAGADGGGPPDSAAEDS